MATLKLSLVVSTVAIFAVTFGAVADSGFNWPRVFLTDLAAVNWRSQFNADLVIHLALFGVWVWWREGGGFRALVYGIFSVVWGGMFTFPYLLVALTRSGGNMREFFFGKQAVAWAN